MITGEPASKNGAASVGAAVMIGRPFASDIVEHSAQVCRFIKYAPLPCSDIGTDQGSITRSCHEY